MTQTLATDQTWWDQAACRGLSPEWFVPVGDSFEDTSEEPWDPHPLAKRFCDACPVRVECLAFALAHPELRGTWGGLSWHQRRQARRVRRRQACPDCHAPDVLEISGGQGQVCLGCGLSWRTTSGG